MNLPECSNQNISKCTKILPFSLIGLGWSLKKESSPKFGVRIISHLPEFISSGRGGQVPPSPSVAYATRLLK